VAQAVLFLVSPAANAITGVNLPVDAGWPIGTSWQAYGGLPTRRRHEGLLSLLNGLNDEDPVHHPSSCPRRRGSRASPHKGRKREKGPPAGKGHALCKPMTRPERKHAPRCRVIR